jgi:phosphatidylserine decarboxylase
MGQIMNSSKIRNNKSFQVDGRSFNWPKLAIEKLCEKL